MLVFLFTDIEGSTRLWEEHTGVMTGVIARHDEILQEQIEGHGGRITKHTGDGITAAFEGGQPITCALETQKRFAAEPWAEIGALPIRAGIHAGEAEFHASAGTPEGDYFGPPVNATARIMSAAWGGQILLTPEVTETSSLPAHASLLDLGEHLLKNVTAPQRLYQLLHPQLPRQDFPPPRTLSGQSIRRAVDERGHQFAELEPQAMGIGLLSATLLPTLVGDLRPDSPALQGNLGVLHDLGAGDLAEFLAGFAQELPAVEPEAMRPEDLRIHLETALRQRWQDSPSLRADASLLLQAVRGVEATMIAAADDVKEALARGLAGLGSQFGEFHWMLAGVQDTLAEMRARQALQLALQREQLDLQRQQLVKTNLLLHRQQERPTLAQLTVEGEVDEEPPATAAPAAVACPYMGLAAFEAEDAEYFFGREELVAELTARLAGTRFLAVVGPSGSGKSSVVRAGLLPAVWAGALPGSKDWQTLVLTPGAHPLEQMAVRVALLNGYTAGALLRELEEDHRSLHLAVEQALAEQPEAVKLLLVVDQFEEIFALCHDEEERQRTIEALLYAVEAEEGRTIVLPIIRADFYGRCADYANLAAWLADGVLVGPMSEEELRQAVERPAVQVGLRLEPGLADTIVGEVADEPGALPLLSHALLETFERRRGRTLTLSGYAESGGVAGAIAQTADTVCAGLSGEEQAIARSIFLRLTELGEEGAQDTRRRVAPQELVRTPEESRTVEAVLKTLADARLVTTGEGSVEVAHEALIREWPELRGWLEEDREGLRTHRHLTDAAQEWERLECEPGELYRGARLATASEWAEAHAEALNPLEREFLAASQELAQRREAEREARRQRELEAAQKLAAEQEKRADVEQRRAEDQTRAAGQLRRLALLLAGAMNIAEEKAREALEAYSQSLAAHANNALENGDTATGLALALAANDMDQPPELSQHILRQAAYSPGARRQYQVAELFPDVDGRIYSLAMSPVEQEALIGFEDGSLILWDVMEEAEIHRLVGHSGTVRAVAFSPDGQTALTGSSDRSVILWDLETGREIRRFEGHDGWVRTVDFSPDGQAAVSGGFVGNAAIAVMNPGELILWNVETGEEIRRFEGHPSGVVAVTFSPDGRTALASSGVFGDVQMEFSLILWDVKTGEMVHNFEPDHENYSVAISPDGDMALTGANDNNVYLWDLETGERVRTFEGHQGVLTTVAFTPDGRRAISGEWNGRLILWDLTTGEQTISAQVHHAEEAWSISDLPAMNAATDPQGRTVLTSAGDGTLVLWDLFNAGEIRRLEGHSTAVWAVAFTPDGEYALTGAGYSAGYGPVAEDNSLRLWDIDTGELIRVFEGHTDAVLQVTISADGRRVLSGAMDGSMRLWDLENGDEIRIFQGYPEGVGVFSVAFSPNGHTGLSGPLACGSPLILWDLESGEIIHSIDLGDDNSTTLYFNPDDRTAYGSQGPTSLYDLESGQEIRRYSAGSCTGFAIHPDGRTAFVVGDRNLREWDLETDREIRVFGEHKGFRTRVALNPDGRTMLSSGWDGTLFLWDLETGHEIHRFASHDNGFILDIAISPDGRTAIVPGTNGAAILWRLDLPSSLNEVRDWIDDNRYVRELSCEERETYRIEPLCEG